MNIRQPLDREQKNAEIRYHLNPDLYLHIIKRMVY